MPKTMMKFSERKKMRTIKLLTKKASDISTRKQARRVAKGKRTK
jgi:hypothetical protein